jgi:putative thioredoxin
MNANTDAHEVKSFETDVLARSASTPVVVDFWAAWCGPCRVLGPVLERLAGKSEGRWELAKVDVDAHQDVAARYGVSGIPAVKMFVDGAVVGEFTGALPEQMVSQWLRRFLPAKSAKETSRAEELIAREQWEEAREVLERVLEEDPASQHARTLLATTLLFPDAAKAASLVKEIEEDSPDFPAVEMIRTIADLKARINHPESLPADDVKERYLEAAGFLFAHRYDEALDGFIDVIRTNRYYDDDGSRKAVIAMFRFLGDDHESTRSHRRDFGSALNS